MTWTEAKLIQAVRVMNWESALTEVTAWVEAHPQCICLTESLRDVQLKPVSPVDIQSLQETLSGRLFTTEEEIRWTRDGLTGCFLHESSEGEHGLPCEKLDRNYFLTGIWQGDCFTEPNLPHRREHYFPDLELKKNSRAYILVREYRPLAPVSFNLDEPSSLAVQLNPPKLIGHRCVEIGEQH